MLDKRDAEILNGAFKDQAQRIQKLQLLVEALERAIQTQGQQIDRLEKQNGILASQVVR